MKLWELLDLSLLDEMIEEKYVKVNQHPALDLFIYNYTEKTQFSQHWNSVTKKTRGLVVKGNGDVVARPFEKFFNFGELGSLEGQMSLDELVVVTDKMDGSLGILYPVESPDGHVTFAIATRGSFTSDQAAHATKVLNERYSENFKPRFGWTYLFEIIYPENRIVVDYKGLDDLVLLAVVDTYSGRILAPDMAREWPGRATPILHTGSLREALRLPLRPGKEGVVIRSLMDGLMVKVKQPDYVELHRIVTNLSPKTIWERCVKADLELAPEVSRKDAVLDGLPDEFYDTVWSTANEFFRQVWEKEARAWSLFRTRPYSLVVVGREARKRFARWNQSHTDWLAKALWLCYDGRKKELREYLWKTIKPRGDEK